MSTEIIRALIVDDHAVVRSGYRAYLEAKGDFEVVSEAATAADAYAQYKRCKTDIVIMDIMLGGASGLDASRRILSFDAEARILAFSMYAEPIVIRQAIDVGVLGILSKASTPERLYEAAVAVSRGQRYLDADLALSMAFPRHAAGPKVLEKLSPREFEIFQMLIGGSTNDEIAATLSLSAKTVANRLSMIRHKLEATSDIQLLKIAVPLGIVPWIQASTAADSPN